jgi:hypothetical protein
MYGTIEGKIIQDKIQAYRFINVMTYLKFKLKLKFRNYSSVIVNFHTRFTPKTHLLKIKIR